MIKDKYHKGIILDVSRNAFDSGGATFATVFHDEENCKEYMFYTGASDTKWSKASIGLALSRDGINFIKQSEPLIDPQEYHLREVVTPVIFSTGSYFYMAFAGSPLGKGRRIFLAYSDDPKGPWKLVKAILEPKCLWEGTSVDLGPSYVKLSETEVLLYYSNVSNRLRECLFYPRWWPNHVWLRRIGILKLKIRSPYEIEAYRFEGNPLKHLNGPKGSWKESLFCPGYFKLGDKHYLLPATSIYSVGFPYRQYIGLVLDSSPYFMNPKSFTVLIDGSKEKKQQFLR